MYVWSSHSKGKDQPGKAANPARGQLNRENDFFHVPVRAPENLVSRHGYVNSRMLITFSLFS